MNTRVAILSLATVSAWGLAGLAQPGAPTGSWYVAPEALWLSPDSKLDANSKTGFRVAIGKSLTENWDAELAYTQTKHSPKNGSAAGDLKLGFAELDFKRVFDRDSRCNPFIDLGIGNIHSEYAIIAGSSDNELGGKVGVGAFVGLGSSAVSRVQLMADAGVRLDAVKSHSSPVDPYVALGLRVNIGGEMAASAAPALGAAAGPAPAPVAAPPPPAPAPVDSDGDGVPDNLDKCPNTPLGDKVDADGCSLSMNLQVNFKTNSAQIDAESDAELDHFVQLLKDVPSARGELQGHTDSVGKPAYNLKLSQRRADAVKANVVAKGIDAGRLTTKGYGETQPVADNKTEDGRAQNRRVLFVRESARL